MLLVSGDHPKTLKLNHLACFIRSTWKKRLEEIGVTTMHAAPIPISHSIDQVHQFYLSLYTFDIQDVELHALTSEPCALNCFFKVRSSKKMLTF